MKELKIIIDGKEHPCYSTVGAFRRFEKSTGKKYTELDPESMTDLSELLWACTKAACAREKVAFDYSADDFADNITAEQLTAWYRSLRDGDGGDADGDGEKKSPLTSWSSTASR